MKQQFNIYLAKREYYQNNALLPLTHTMGKKKLSQAE